MRPAGLPSRARHAARGREGLREGGAARDARGGALRAQAEAEALLQLHGEPAPAPPEPPAARTAPTALGERPNRLWATDITEFRLPGDAGKCYLSAVLDCFDGRPVAWSIGARPTAELAELVPLRAACATLAPGERPVVHSDRGGHYRWKGWVALCRGNRLVRSMSRKGEKLRQRPPWRASSARSSRSSSARGTRPGSTATASWWSCTAGSSGCRSGRISASRSAGGRRTGTAGCWDTRCRMYRKSSAVPSRPRIQAPESRRTASAKAPTLAG